MPAYQTTMFSRTESGTPDSLKIVVKYHLTPATPAARAAAYRDLMGGIRLVRGRLRYVRPARDAAFPWCYCSSFSSEPIEEDFLLDTSEASTTYASGKLVVTVTYEPKTVESSDAETSDSPDSADQNEEPTEMDLLNREWDFSVRDLTLPNQFMMWKTTKNAGGRDALIGNDGIAAVKRIPQMDYILTRFYVRNKPTDAITSLMGRVNKTDFWLGNERYRAEMLRFESAKSTQKVTNFGTKFFEMSYKFAIQPTYDRIQEDDEVDAKGNNIRDAITLCGYVGWNRLYNPRTNFWERVVWQGNPDRGTYLLDENAPSQKIQGKDVVGFRLLFNSFAK